VIGFQPHYEWSHEKRRQDSGYTMICSEYLSGRRASDLGLKALISGPDYKAHKANVMLNVLRRHLSSASCAVITNMCNELNDKCPHKLMCHSKT